MEVLDLNPYVWWRWSCIHCYAGFSSPVSTRHPPPTPFSCNGLITAKLAAPKLRVLKLEECPFLDWDRFRVCFVSHCHLSTDIPVSAGSFPKKSFLFTNGGISLSLSVAVIAGPVPCDSIPIFRGLLWDWNPRTAPKPAPQPGIPHCERGTFLSRRHPCRPAISVCVSYPLPTVFRFLRLLLCQS
mgnify:CR=1 FL=1